MIDTQIKTILQDNIQFQWDRFFGGYRLSERSIQKAVDAILALFPRSPALPEEVEELCERLEEVSRWSEKGDKWETTILEAASLIRSLSAERDFYKAATEQAEAHAAAVQAASLSTLPAGWVVVPKEPTEEMILAARFIQIDQESPFQVWSAMINAAPSNPSED